MDISEPLNDKTSNPASNALVTSRWAADSAEPSQTGKTTTKAYQKNKHKTKKNHQQVKKLGSNLNQPLKSTDNHEAPSATTKPTAHRIIGPLSQEEKEVRMENPFFDPTKLRASQALDGQMSERILVGMDGGSTLLDEGTPD